MGMWNITIQGTGAHHNFQTEHEKNDANKIAAEFVKQLIAAGHFVESATFTAGGRDDLIYILKNTPVEPGKSTEFSPPH